MKKNIILTTIAGLLISGIILGNRHRVILNTTSDKVLAVGKNDTVKDGQRKALPKDTTQTDGTNEGRGGDVSDGGEPSVSLPDMPETEGFAPTMMSDIEPATPASKINIIAPPSANNHGTASLSYAFEMPPARNGMAPQLGLQYSSDGGSGFCGEGWDMPIPSITVDTRWGVPRYDPDNETETYLLNGEMLCFKTGDSLTTAHRTPNVPRTENCRFYARRGGDFSRIVRKGTSLSNYYWEVTDNNGTVYTYGSSNHTDGHLKGTFTDATGSQRTVTAEWKLTKVQEIHGDHTDYSYAKPDEGGFGQTSPNSSLLAKAIYPSSVNVYRAENNTPYITVNFISDASHTKNMRRSNARYGFLTSSNRLLQRVDILFRDTLLRSYPLTYINGAYNKKLLSKVTHKDNHGNDVSFNQFTYHNSNIGNTLPFKSSPNKTLNTSPDDAGFPVSVGGLDDEATAIGGSKTKGLGGGVYAGVGTFDANGTKKNSAGMSVSYNQSTTKGLTTLVDINGDGLADRLFVKDNMLKVNLQNPNGGFYTAVQIAVPINDFMKTTTTTYGGGTQGYLSPAQAGLDHSLSKSKTTTYLADVNGDGLVDIVSGETVYFNTTKPGDAVPSFSTDSHATGVPYDGGGTVQFSNTYDAQERDSLLKYSPMVDAVRVWTAPVGGNISISGSVRRLLPSAEEASSAEYKDADLMKTSIQYQNVIKWSKIIQKGDGASYSANSSFHVSAGEKVFFRVQSGTNQLSNGSFDKVVWAPEIRYTGYDFQAVDTLNYSPADYQNAVYKTSQAVSWSQDTPVPVSGTTATIHGSISQTAALSEAVKLRVVRLNSYGQQMSHTDFGVTSVINQTVSLNGASFIRLEFFSEGNVQWEKLRPRLQITCAGNTFNAPVKYLCYNRQYKAGRCYKREHALLFPKIHFSSQIESDSVHMVVKTFSNLLVHASTYAIQNTDYFNLDNTYYVPISGDSVIVEYYFKNPTTAGKVQHALFYMADNAADVPTSWNEIMTDDSLSVMQTGDEADRTSHADDSSNSAGDVNMRTGNWYASVYSRVEPTAICPDYRGWSLISYIPDAAGYNGPINLSRLVPPTAQSNVMFHPLCIMRQDSVTVPAFGHSRNVWVHGDTLCAGRLSVPEVRAVNPLASLNGSHSEAFGIPLVTKNSSTDIMGGAGAAFFSMSGNVATGNSKTTTAFMDMNGDGYPDILGDGHIQYTGPLGSYGNDKASLSMEGVQSAASISRANTAGGQAVHAFSRKGHPENGAERTAKIAGNLSTTGGSSDDTSEWEYIDLNGDGLPDLLNFQDGKAKYNLGYAFTVETTVSNLSPTTMHGYDATVSIGGSFDYGLSSFAGGTAGAKTTNYSKCEYIDLNGDGLPDKVTYDNNTNTAKVFLNTGAGFSTTVINLGSALFQENATQSESVNMAYTLSIPITGTTQRVVMNPSVHTSWSANATKKAIRDIDGDGYPDILTSSSPTSLTIKRSDIGCTNMLQTVTNSLGGTFTIEYSRTTASCDHPGGKWAMSALTIDDGIHDDGPNQRQTFVYANGKYDRREREFLGFGTVTTNDINTALSNTSIYRKHVEEYDVSDWYAQGNLLSAAILKNSSVKSKDTYVYYHYKATPALGNDSTSDTGMSLTTGVTSNGAMFMPLKYSSKALATTVMSEYYYTYKTSGSHGEVATVRYSDQGTLTSNGSNSYNRMTSYTYQYANGNGNMHVYGLPAKNVVADKNGIVYHETSYTYHNAYPTQVTRVARKVGSVSATTDYTYDSYGNVRTVTLPPNGNASPQRMVHTYEYDSILHTHIKQIGDSYGYHNHRDSFDLRYGVSRWEYDRNGVAYKKYYDDLGRLTGVNAPKELNTISIGGYEDENPPYYTISFDYYPHATFSSSGISQPAYARTRRLIDKNDPNNPVYVDTYVFVDGFGRVIQTREKTVVSVSNGYSMSSQTGFTASGRVKYDAMGRPVEEYYPVFHNETNGSIFKAGFDSQPPTTMTYDELDRVLTVSLPDGSTSTTYYSAPVNPRAMLTSTTDALGNRTVTYTNGSGQVVQKLVYASSTERVKTEYTYDGIGRLLTVKDAKSNTTTYTYDMADRVTQVNHPASGKSKYTYDLAGNLTQKITAANDTISYRYYFNRQIRTLYPKHPENNVCYVYGGNASGSNNVGRLMLRIDGSGATQYTYGTMGEVVSELKTLIVPNRRIATFETQWDYDSHGRLLSMTYPDDELVTYHYNLTGQLQGLTGYRDGHNYTYISNAGYDKFGRMFFTKLGNGETELLTFDGTTQRLNSIALYHISGNTLTKSFTYDDVGNITATNGSILGNPFSHEFTYLAGAMYMLGTASGRCQLSDKYASYELSMAYDNVYRVNRKNLSMEQNGLVPNGVNTYNSNYTYHYKTNSGKKFQIAKVSEVGSNPQTHTFRYDKNGCIDSIGTPYDNVRYLWDEENRLLAASYNGYVSSYIYDADGNRTVKLSAPYEAVYTNSADATPPSDTLRYTLYVGPHYTVTGTTGSEDVEPRYVKHFFIGNKRVASKIANAPGYDPRGITTVAGKSIYVKVDYPVKYGEQKAQVSGNYTNFAMPYSNIDMNNYDYPFNRPGYWNGCVPPNNTGTVVIRGNRDSESEETDSIGEPEQRTSPVENLAFYYHTDHLGSTNLVTDRGRSICHATEYLPYGEVFVDLQTSGSDPDLPFKFNGKEMDPETGMLYYGARYYMPKYYQWPTCDPLELKYPGVSSYSFCHNNPLNRIDLLGLYDTEAEAAKAASSYHAQYYQDRQSGKWFVALNEYGNGAYMSGGTMTRDFGTKDNLDIKGFYNTNFAPYSHIDFRYYNHLLQNVSSNTSTGFTVMSNVAKRTQPVLKMFGISKHLSDSHLKAFKLMNGLGNVAGGIGVVTSLIEGYHSSDIKKAECYSDALFGTIGLSGYGVPISLIYSLGGKDLSRKQVSIQMKTGIIGLPSTMPTKY